MWDITILKDDVVVASAEKISSKRNEIHEPKHNKVELINVILQNNVSIDYFKSLSDFSVVLKWPSRSIKFEQCEWDNTSMKIMDGMIEACYIISKERLEELLEVD